MCVRARRREEGDPTPLLLEGRLLSRLCDRGREEGALLLPLLAYTKPLQLWHFQSQSAAHAVGRANSEETVAEVKFTITGVLTANFSDPRAIKGVGSPPLGGRRGGLGEWTLGH